MGLFESSLELDVNFHKDPVSVCGSVQFSSVYFGRKKHHNNTSVSELAAQ